jgi:hypothetical protein
MHSVERAHFVRKSFMGNDFPGRKPCPNGKRPSTTAQHGGAYICVPDSNGKACPADEVFCVVVPLESYPHNPCGLVRWSQKADDRGCACSIVPSVICMPIGK